jgi:hypothetical protein
VLFAGLRNRYTFGGPETSTAFGLFVAAVFLVSVYYTIAGERKHTQRVMALAALIIAAGTALSLAKVVHLVIYEASTIDAIRLIETAFAIWVPNVVVFAIVYHAIGVREFAFPRPAGQPADQAMAFLDYIFLSFTTATAFSPTDTAPLSTRARMLMMFEAIVSLVVIAIVAARAINILQ